MKKKRYLAEFPDYDDLLQIPKGWVDSSSPDDPCPSITDKNKIVKIFQDYKNPGLRKDWQCYPRFCAIIIDPRYQSEKFQDKLGLTNLENFKDVLHLSQNFIKSCDLVRA